MNETTYLWPGIDLESYSTMSVESLNRLFELAHLVRDVPGAIVECGVMNGGSAVALVAGAEVFPREVWLFDSWKGQPPPGKFDGPGVHEIWTASEGKLFKGTMKKTRGVFRESGVEGKLHLVRGWFSETIPTTRPEIGPIALLHVDACWYKCTRQALFGLYAFVADGGLIIVEDYFRFTGVGQAVDELRRKLWPLDQQLGRVAGDGCWWRKA